MGLLFAVGIPRAAQMVWGKSQGAKAAEMEIAQPAKLRIFALFRPAMGHSAALLLVAAILLLSSTLNHAQTSPPVIRRAQAQNQTPAIVANPLLDPAPAVAPPTLENKPPTPPQVTWNGAQLSIKAENSTLADILSVVRARTNVVIEIPPGAGAERVFTDLGPASPREVLTSLLTGSNFDYVIMASPDNKDVLQSVLLTPRGKGESGAGGELPDIPTPTARPWKLLFKRQARPAQPNHRVRQLHRLELKKVRPSSHSQYQRVGSNSPPSMHLQPRPTLPS